VALKRRRGPFGGMWWAMSQKILLLIALFAPILLSAAGVMLHGPNGGARESEEAGTGDGI
jgi:hypothetical protein